MKDFISKAQIELFISFLRDDKYSDQVIDVTRLSMIDDDPNRIPTHSRKIFMSTEGDVGTSMKSMLKNSLKNVMDVYHSDFIATIFQTTGPFSLHTDEVTGSWNSHTIVVPLECTKTREDGYASTYILEQSNIADTGTMRIVNPQKILVNGNNVNQERIMRQHGRYASLGGSKEALKGLVDNIPEHPVDTTEIKHMHKFPGSIEVMKMVSIERKHVWEPGTAFGFESRQFHVSGDYEENGISERMWVLIKPMGELKDEFLVRD